MSLNSEDLMTLQPHSLLTSFGLSPGTIPDVILQILISRGVDSREKLDGVFQPTLKSLRDPQTLHGMARAVERLLAAREAQEHVCIYADYDLDGTSGLAMMLTALPLLGFENVSGYQPGRLTEGYGLHNAAIEKLKTERKIDLLLTVDLGITAVEEVRFAKSLGIDVIVTDHHLPQEVLPAAFALINPNQGAQDQSGLGHLCGAGVAFYLILALRREFQSRGLLTEDFDPKSLLDFFAIATLTDMVPLVDENRVLVKHGLARLSKTTRPGLSELLKALDLDGRELSSQDVGIRFAPKLNALSRMDADLRPIDLFVCESRDEAKSWVGEILKNNEDRVQSQKLAIEIAESEWQRISERSEAHGGPAAIVLFHPEFHRGVVGLVATKMVQKYGRPAFIGAVGPTGQVNGSARLPDKSGASLVEALHSTEKFLFQFGGHAKAAGFELDLTKQIEFTEQIQTYFNTVDASQTEQIRSDADASLADLTPQFMKWWENLGPFGTGWTIPKLKFSNLRLSSAKILKDVHLKLQLREENPQRPSMPFEAGAIWFQAAKLDFVDHVGETVDLIAEPQWNEFAGRKTIQLVVHDVWLSRSK